MVVDALRRSLDALPHTDSELRCRVMLGLAGELYYGSSPQERDALAEEAVAIARRIGDPALLMRHLPERLRRDLAALDRAPRAALAQEALGIAERLGDARALVYAQTVRAVSRASSARSTCCEELTRRPAAGRGAPGLYALVVLDSLEIPWLAMRGEHERAAELTAHLAETGTRMGLSQQDDAVAGAVLSTLMWQGRSEEVLEMLRLQVKENILPLDASVLALLVRGGRLEEARAYRADHEPELGGDTWFSLLPWCPARESALALGDRTLAATAYRLLAPHAGKMALRRLRRRGRAGRRLPRDGSRGTGEARHRGPARRRRLALCRAWRIPLVAQWLRDQRDRYGF